MWVIALFDTGTQVSTITYDEWVLMLVLKSSSPYSSRVPILLGTTVLDRAMARITVEELACANDTWQKTYISTMVTSKVSGTVEMKDDDPPLITL